MISGPSLPPQLCGDLMGTLVIHLHHCQWIPSSLPRITEDGVRCVQARLKFWGLESSHVDLVPPEDAVECPLVGSLVGIRRYILDMHISITVWLKRQKPTRDGGRDDEEVEVLVGLAQFPIADILSELQVGVGKTTLTSLCRKVHMMLQSAGPKQDEEQLANSESGDRDGPSAVIGVEAILRLQVAQPSCAFTQIPNESESAVPLVVDEAPADWEPAASSDHKHIDGYESSDGEMDDTLDLCLDDITLSTVSRQDTNDEVTLSSLLTAAGSAPPSIIYPSLALVDAQRGRALATCNFANISIATVTITERLASLCRRALRILGNQACCCVRYNLPPGVVVAVDNERSCDEDGLVRVPIANMVSIVQSKSSPKRRIGREKKIPRSKRRNPASSTPIQSSACTERKDEVHNVHHSNLVGISFRDDEIVQAWLESKVCFQVVVFRSSASQQLQKEDPDEQATLSVLASATFPLRDIFFSSSQDVRALLDLQPEDDDGAVETIPLGSIAVRLSLIPGTTSSSLSGGKPECPPLALPTATPSSRLAPVPVAKAQNSNDDRAAPWRASDYHQTAECNGVAPSCEESPRPRCVAPAPKSCATSQQAPLRQSPKAFAASFNPELPPPLWLRVDVNSLVIVDVHAATIPNRIRIRASCAAAVAKSKTEATYPRSDVAFRDVVFRPKVDRNGLTGADIGLVWIPALDANYSAASVMTEVWALSNVEDACERQVSSSLPPVGIAKIPLDTMSFSRAPSSNSVAPSVMMNGWMNLRDPFSGAARGSLHCTVAVGLLRQIRRLPLLLEKAEVIQHWWARRRVRQEAGNSNGEEERGDKHLENSSRKEEAVKIQQWWRRKMDRRPKVGPKDESSSQSTFQAVCRFETPPPKNESETISYARVPSNPAHQASNSVSRDSAEELDCPCEQAIPPVQNGKGGDDLDDESLVGDCNWTILIRIGVATGLRELVSLWYDQHFTPRKGIECNGMVITFCLFPEDPGGGELSGMQIHSSTRIITLRPASAGTSFDFEESFTVKESESVIAYLRDEEIEFRLWFIPTVTQESIKTNRSRKSSSPVLPKNAMRVGSARLPLHGLLLQGTEICHQIPWNPMTEEENIGSLEVTMSRSGGSSHQAGPGGSPLQRIHDAWDCEAELLHGIGLADGDLGFLSLGEANKQAFEHQSDCAAQDESTTNALLDRAANVSSSSPPKYDDDTMCYRDLSCVLKSLDHINVRLEGRFDQERCTTANKEPVKPETKNNLSPQVPSALSTSIPNSPACQCTSTSTTTPRQVEKLQPTPTSIPLVPQSDAGHGASPENSLSQNTLTETVGSRHGLDARRCGQMADGTSQTDVDESKNVSTQVSPAAHNIEVVDVSGQTRQTEESPCCGSSVLKNASTNTMKLSPDVDPCLSRDDISPGASPARSSNRSMPDSLGEGRARSLTAEKHSVTKKHSSDQTSLRVPAENEKSPTRRREDGDRLSSPSRGNARLGRFMTEETDRIAHIMRNYMGPRRGGSPSSSDDEY